MLLSVFYQLLDVGDATGRVLRWRKHQRDCTAVPCTARTFSASMAKRLFDEHASIEHAIVDDGVLGEAMTLPTMYGRSYQA